MELLDSILRFLHVGFGFIGLAAFWVPIFSRKGASNHVRFGKVFVWSAYVVLAGAALVLLLRYIDLAGRGIGPADEPGLFAFMLFLAYLTLITLATVRHGMTVLRYKRDPRRARNPLSVGLAWASIAASLFIISYALVLRPPVIIVLLALSPIGFGVGFGNLRYMNNPPASPRAWMYEHLGAMLGGGIAFHTAFAVFGSTRLFDLDITGWLAVIPWVLPAAIGIPATALWTRHYRRKFGELGSAA